MSIGRTEGVDWSELAAYQEQVRAGIGDEVASVHMSKAPTEAPKNSPVDEFTGDNIELRARAVTSLDEAIKNIKDAIPGAVVIGDQEPTTE